MHCEKGSEDAVLRYVREIPEVQYSYRVDKAYDVVVKIESDSIEKFTAAIAKIRSAPHLLNTDTMIGFRR